jgi:hypothetical protein
MANFIYRSRTEPERRDVPTPAEAAREGRRIRSAANQLARAEAGLWLLLSGISLRDRMILLNAALTEVLEQVREQERAELL